METTPVQNLAKKLGWREMAGGPPAEMLDAKKKTVTTGHATTNDWYVAGMEALPVMASWMEKAVENPVLTNKKTGEQIQIDFTRSTFFNMFKAEIKNLTARDFGPVDAPDRDQNMQKRRDKWLKVFFR
jgi:hypothetical protein